MKHINISSGGDTTPIKKNNDAKGKSNNEKNAWQ